MKVLKIGAIWCSGCLVMKPRWQEIEKDNPWLETEYFEYDDNPEVMKKYDLVENASLPVFIFLDSSGVEIARLVGEISKDKLLQVINENKNK